MMNLIVNLVVAILVRLLFVAFVLMLGVWGGLEVVDSDANVIEFTQRAVGSFWEVGEVLENAK
jgi:hypothetical protein